MQRPVEFKSEGLTVKGVLWIPDDLEEGERRPGVVTANGFTFPKEFLLPSIAETFMNAGYVALTFDYRFLGESEGEPRGQVHALKQVEDVLNGLSFLETQPQVDRHRLGAWGASYGGGHVLYAAAHDQRIKCVAANLPVTNGRRWLRVQRHTAEWYEFLDRVAADRQRRFEGKPSEIVTAFDIFVPDDETRANFENGWKTVDRWEPYVTMDTAEYWIQYAPEFYVDRISPRAMLLTHAQNDRITPETESISAYERAHEPKKLYLYPSKYSHWDGYMRGADVHMGTVVEWFDEHLGI
ncbi:alpha/beta fold hydrolase [Egibacter rhizosphaerae]|uniref:Alpha/beta fold hydrolase n=1 Tax=Egibacter rhizosphaerae TaxID=1670831 RepID=A0A411YBF7_9ACTN|nr:alpha/beta fold hydrolase [Egibacter rhizosphaerae]QBI18526.1 alpha/beta fold hydrolase [Egibacter rhizosphaerae]